MHHHNPRCQEQYFLFISKWSVRVTKQIYINLIIKPNKENRNNLQFRFYKNKTKTKSNCLFPLPRLQGLQIRKL